MINEIILGFIQAATEFLPVSSSGHLALFGNFFSDVDFFYIVFLHFASLLAILIYTRRELKKMIFFEKGYEKMWFYVLIGILPAALVGFFFKAFIEVLFYSYLAIGISYIFTGSMLIVTSRFNNARGELNKKRSFVVGIAQILALFPGVSRSGVTISFGLFSGLKKEEAFKFSFIMAIPLIIGATIFEWTDFSFSYSFLVGFFVCVFFSLVFLHLLELLLKKNYFWLFGFYCIFLGVVSLYFAFI